ncbi:MAG: ABC transporter ATP-binding protein [Verrucomicrobia bacterium]|nr:ABC transporter ATP-binding protein [Verrucomicrobiota bacterium]
MKYTIQPDVPAVETINLTRTYEALTALNALDLVVNRGDLFGFIGSNGAGKTTTLRILSTFLSPTAGQARVLGYNVVTQADAVRHIIGYMPDFFGVYRDMIVSEYLDFFGACYQIGANQRVQTINDVLELVGLHEKKDQLIGALSRGMQQRLGLARVLIHDPELLLLDEPASGLDPRARVEMMAILQELQKMGKTIIISSHILSELQALCNRVAIIEKGSLKYSGPIEGVGQDLSSHKVFRVHCGPNPESALPAFLEIPELVNPTILKGRISFTLEDASIDPARILHQLISAGVPIRDFHEEEISLEKVFMNYTSGETQ